MEAHELMPKMVQWNNVGIAVGIMKEGRFAPHHKACLNYE